MSADDTLPWTTSRCNRLLRPLSSKLAKLRKELERTRLSSGESRNVSSAFAIKGSPVKTTNFTRPTYKPRGFEKARDPDWRPGPKAGIRKKTYGGRGGRKPVTLHRSRSDSSDVARPGEIAMTPFLVRAAGQLHSSPLTQASPLKRFGKNRGPLLASIDQFTAPRVPADVHKLIQGLSEAYANLLQATTAGDERRWQGTRSLMGACLRKLPAYIELEEHFAELDRLEEEDDTEDRDITNEIYEHLESRFEQRAGQGWRPFRQAVRAHGTALMCSAITDGTLEVQSLGLLLTHCLNVSAWDEAEKLLLAYAPRLEPVTFPVNVKADLFDHQKYPYFAMFKTFVERTSRHRLMYDLLEHTTALELLPLEWLATECMRPIWDRLIRTLSENDVRTVENAHRFFRTAVVASMGLPDQRLLEDEVAGFFARRFVPSTREELRSALNTTFSSLFTVLVSIALANNNRSDVTDQSSVNRISWVLDAVALELSMRDDAKDEIKLLNPETDDAQLFAQRALWTIFATLVPRLDGSVQTERSTTMHISGLTRLVGVTVEAYVTTGINTAAILATIPSFLSSVAQGTGRIWGDDGFDQLQRLVSGLIGITGCRLPHKLWTLKRLALETTMEFAHSTGDRAHAAYFRDLEDKSRTEEKLMIDRSPEKNQSPANIGGFRWEDGIGEWVTCTPFAKQAVKRKSRRAIRVLELLPTPEQTSDEKSENDGELHDGCADLTMDSDDDEHVPQSSPIKSASQRPTPTVASRRTRVASPKVIIPVKRVGTPSCSPATLFFSVQDGDCTSNRRSHRPRREVKPLSSRSRTQRSRNASSSGLRNVARPRYTEAALELDSEEEDEQVSSSLVKEDIDDSSTSVSSTRRMSVSRPWSVLGKRSRVSQRIQAHNDEDSDRDELSKTPARPRSVRRRVNSRQTANQRKEWWKVQGNVVSDSEASSEDELSFQ